MKFPVVGSVARAALGLNITAVSSFALSTRSHGGRLEQPYFIGDPAFHR